MSRKDWQEIVSYVRQEDWQQAIELVNQLIVSEPDDPTHFLKLGDFYLEKRNLEGAKRAYIKASELYNTQSATDKATLALKKALQVDPEDVELQRKLLDLIMTQTTKTTSVSAGQEYRLDENFQLDIFFGSEAFPSVFREEKLISILKKQPLKKFNPGDIIIKEGDIGREVFLVVEGVAKVSTKIQGREIELAKLFPGDIFGEIAFITQRQRVASVLADKGGCVVIEISPETLDLLISEKPEILKYLYDLYRTRLKDS